MKPIHLFPVTETIAGLVLLDYTQSNWWSGVTAWDWLHGILKLDSTQSKIDIGVSAYGTSNDIKFGLLKKMFQHESDSWRKLSAAAMKSRARPVPHQKNMAQPEPLCLM